MVPSSRFDFGVGLGNGFAIAAVFTQIFAVLPDEWLTVGNPLYWAWLAIGSVAISPPTVYIMQWFAKKLFKCSNIRDVMDGCLYGAMTFDSLALSFFPSVYGHDGPQIHGVAASLLLAFTILAYSARFITKTEDGGIDYTKDQTSSILEQDE